MPPILEPMAPTLRPYLDSSRKGIAISFGVDGGTESDLTPMAGSGPFSSQRWGRVRMGAKTSLADLIFTFQSDHYGDGLGEPATLANPDVDRHWLDLLHRLADRDGPGHPDDILMPASGEDMDQPFRPLFHCGQVDAFFHPLCPGCGNELSLCRDDDLLLGAALPAYTRSLDRFLHCPACSAGDDPLRFYARGPLAHPPANVQDGPALMQEFSRLLARTDLEDALPCIGCDHATECYGPPTLVLERMSVFQFYPFFLLIQPAPDIHSLDFLDLVGGAHADELAHRIGLQGRRTRWSRFAAMRPRLFPGGGYLSAGDDPDFEEVLYLKLCFLDELRALVMNGRCPVSPSATLRGMWVRLGGQGGRLPWMWNFRLQPADPVGNPADAMEGNGSAWEVRSAFLARVWFYVLLVNPRQSMDRVWAAVLAAGASGFQPDDPVFSCMHIFWQESIDEPDRQAEDLWHDALQLGLDLLESEGSRLRKDADAFAAALAQLKSRGRDILLRPEPSDARRHSQAERRGYDPQIGDILDSIRARWANRATVVADESAQAEAADIACDSPAGQPNEDGDFEETVILSADGRSIPPSCGPESLQPAESTPPVEDPEPTVFIQRPSADYAGEDLAATVVQTPGEDTGLGRRSGRLIGVSSTMAGNGEEELEKTVVIHPGNVAPPASPEKTQPPPPPYGEEALEKTVVLKPGNLSRDTPTPPHPGEKPGEEDGMDEDLPKTVILRPKDKLDGKR